MLFNPDYRKGGGRIGILRSGKADQGYGLDTSYEQRHPDIYQDKFKHQITLVDIEDAEDSGEQQEVAITEWTRGANPVSCKWVKQQGPAKGFNFDESKVEQVFDLLLREKQLKLPEGHKFPTAQ
jgi:hypothetical protein